MESLLGNGEGSIGSKEGKDSASLLRPERITLAFFFFLPLVIAIIIGLLGHLKVNEMKLIFLMNSIITGLFFFFPSWL